MAVSSRRADAGRADLTGEESDYMLKRTWVWTPIVLVALAAGSYATYRWLTPPGLPEGLLYGSGRIEGTVTGPEGPIIDDGLHSATSSKSASEYADDAGAR